MKFVTILVICLFVSSAYTSELDYQLTATKVAKDTYVISGVTEDFNKANGGNILNTAFIITNAGVVLIDTGPSRLYAQQASALIGTFTNKQVNTVFLTHAHPDHIFGNEYYSEARIYATEKTVSMMQHFSEDFLNNMYRMSGDWMQGTTIIDQEYQLLSEESMSFGGHNFRFYYLKGHTDSDLMILDETTGVLFTGDLVFHNRAPSTAHADIERWLVSLSFLSNIQYTLLVPGHGPVASDNTPIAQTSQYLRWLNDRVLVAVNDGLTINEVLQQPIPGRFDGFGALANEYQRSVMQLFSRYEQAFFGGR